jgi:protein SCO1/2
MRWWTRRPPWTTEAMKALRYTLWGAVAVFAALLAWLAWQSQSGPRTAALDIGMPFTLASSKGGTLSSESLKGKPYAMFFGFTHCPVICPTTLYEMDTALKTLGDEGKDLRMLFVSVDPEQDTQAFMANYVANFDANDIATHWRKAASGIPPAALAVSTSQTAHIAGSGTW